MTTESISPGRRRWVAALAALPATLCLPVEAAESTWPNRYVRIIVGFQAGGITDAMARLLAQELTQVLGQQFVVENKAGASGITGSDFVVKSPPDASVIGMCPSGLMVLYKSLGMKLPFDPAKDLVPVTQFYEQDLLLMVRADSDVHTFADLIAKAKANPDKVTYGSTGIGGPLHLGTEALNLAAGVRMVHVPYKGETPMLPDVSTGLLDVAIGSAQFATTHSARLRPVASYGTRRNARFPDVPTVQETYPGVTANSWQGLFLPAGTPRALQDKVSAAMMAAIRGPLRNRIVEAGLTPVGGTPEELSAYIASETERWGAIIRKVGVRLE